MKILIVSAHPDDETFGCAGTLLAHRAAGDDLYWLIVTKATEPRWSKEAIATAEKEVEAVAKALGVKEHRWSGLPATSLDSRPMDDVIQPLREMVERVKPAIVYTVHHGDVHGDHRAVFHAVNVVLKAFYMKSHGVRRLLSFECLSSTDAAPPLTSQAFLPNVYRDITPYLEGKIALLKLYESQLQGETLPRSASAVRALARYRGATVGVEFAEAFMLIREVL